MGKEKHKFSILLLLALIFPIILAVLNFFLPGTKGILWILITTLIFFIFAILLFVFVREYASLVSFIEFISTAGLACILAVIIIILPNETGIRWIIVIAISILYFAALIFIVKKEIFKDLFLIATIIACASIFITLYPVFNEIPSDKIIESEVKFIAVSAGNKHGVAIDENADLWTWGNNSDGQLGNGTYAKKEFPIRIMNESKFKAISAGFHHTIAIDVDDNLWTWGANDKGQLGNGSSGIYKKSNSPIKIKDDIKFQSISAQQNQSFAIDIEGNLWAWGENKYGQLGDGTNKNKTIPTKIKDGIKFKSISAGHYHTYHSN